MACVDLLLLSDFNFEVLTISRGPLVAAAAAGKRCGDRSSDRKFDFTHYTLMPALKLSDLNRYLAF